MYYKFKLFWVMKALIKTNQLSYIIMEIDLLIKWRVEISFHI